MDLADVRWTDGFWADRFATARDVSLPRLRLIEVIGEVQEEDGYTASQTRARGWPRFKVPHHHELYTMGHLLTAACAHHRVTGQDNFLKIARGVADSVSQNFTPRDEALADLPFNPSIIMGSVDLYRATGEEVPLDLARFFIDWRGSRYGDGQRSSWGPVIGGSDQTQNWRPSKRESEVVGHAVFFTYRPRDRRPGLRERPRDERGPLPRAALGGAEELPAPADPVLRLEQPGHPRMTVWIPVS